MERLLLRRHEWPEEANSWVMLCSDYFYQYSLIKTKTKNLKPKNKKKVMKQMTDTDVVAMDRLISLFVLYVLRTTSISRINIISVYVRREL